VTEEVSQQTPPEQPRFDWRAQLDKLRRPGPQQIGLMVGAAAILALIAMLFLWTVSESYQPLYRGLSEADGGEVMEALQQHQIPFQIDQQTGTLLVPASQVHEARLKLASQGLPQGTVDGFEMLDQKSGFGVSQFMENARYQRALEGELAHSIMSIGAVKNARVHLALPKETVFVRNRQAPTASVLVQLHTGRVLGKGQVAAIVHLVSSSVPKLSADQVSVIDQAGNLLTHSKRDSGLGLSLDQLDYTRRLEDRYTQRIEDILTPILGMGRVRAQVSLDVDFTVSEETAERYDPKQPPGMMRSERVLEETNGRGQPIGIPGALTNQPPGAATVPEQAAEQADNANNPQNNPNQMQRQRKELTRNYELDKRISHTRNAPGQVQRLSVAVVLDDRMVADAAGTFTRTPLTPEELERMTALVKDAVGFNGDRGDTVNVVNATFAASPFAENPLPFWQEVWFLELVKWAVIGLLALLVLLMVVRPLVRRLLTAMDRVGEKQGTRKSDKSTSELPQLEDHALEGLLEEDRVELTGGSGMPRLGSSLQELDKHIKLARALVAEDPKRTVQVIKHWIANED
jgi:flagellar M-ring protein FliF